MTLELTDEQRQAIDAENADTVRIVDPRDGQVYVLVRETVYSKILPLVTDDLAETYPAQVESAMRAGWDDPEMDAYNEYDKHRPA